jgi:hypothetical protein
MFGMVPFFPWVHGLSDVASLPIFRLAPDHAHTSYRSPGCRAHRKWKRARAAGITPRSRR